MANATAMTLRPREGKKMSFQRFLMGEAVVKQITKYIPNAQERKIFITSLSSAVSETSSLAECDHKSLISAGLKCQSMGFLPGNETGDVFLVPFGKKCTVMLGYKGLVRLALRSGKIRCLNMGVTRQGQTVVINYLTGDVDIQGAPEAPDAPVTGHFAYMRLSEGGFEKTVYRTKQESILHAQKYAKSSFDAALYAKYESYLQTGEGLSENEKEECKKIYYQQFDSMAMKNCLRSLLLNWAPLTMFEREIISSDGNMDEDEDGILVMDADVEPEISTKKQEALNASVDNTFSEQVNPTDIAERQRSAEDDFFGRG